MSIQKFPGRKYVKPVQRGRVTDVTPCQPIKFIVYMCVSRQIMGFIRSYVLINLVLCILLQVKIIVHVCAFIGLLAALLLI